MISVQLIDNMRRVSKNVDENKTINQIFEENGFDTSFGSVMLSGSPTNKNMTLANAIEIWQEEEDMELVNPTLSVIANTKNAVTVKNVGSVCMIVSDIDKETYGETAKYAPEKLTLTDKDGNDIFSVGYAEGKPQLSKTFVTLSEEYQGKLAMPYIASKDQMLNDHYKELLALKAVEQQITNNLANIQADKQAVEMMFAS